MVTRTHHRPRRRRVDQPTRRGGGVVLFDGDRVCGCVDQRVGRGNRAGKRHGRLSARQRFDAGFGRQPFRLIAGVSNGSPCSTGWAYETGSVDGGEVHHGLLGEADEPAVYVLDDRFFVVIEISPDVQRAPTTWLIDSLSGGHAELTWRDEPTTVSAREQALVVSDGPWSVARWPVSSQSMGWSARGTSPSSRAVPAPSRRRSDGTIRPLAVPDTRGPIFPSHSTERAGSGSGPSPAATVSALLQRRRRASWTDVALPAELDGDQRWAGTPTSWRGSLLRRPARVDRG